MKWKEKEAKSKRNEKNWYPYFPLFYPIKIEDTWYWFTWVEERYTGMLTGQDGEKIYEHRVRRTNTQTNGPVHILSFCDWVILVIIALIVFVMFWNGCH